MAPEQPTNPDNQPIVPRPESSGSDGKQRESSAHPVEIPQSLIDPDMPMVKHVAGIAESNSRALGGGTQTALVLGMLYQLQHELTESKRESRERGLKVDELNTRLTTTLVSEASLKAQVRFERDHRNTRALLLTIGGASFAMAIEVLKVEPSLAVGLGLIAVVCFVCGWIGVPRSKSE